MDTKASTGVTSNKERKARTMTIFNTTIGDGIPATKPVILETHEREPIDFQVTDDPDVGLMFFIGNTALTESGARLLSESLASTLFHLDADRWTETLNDENDDPVRLLNECPSDLRAAFDDDEDPLNRLVNELPPLNSEPDAESLEAS